MTHWKLFQRLLKPLGFPFIGPKTKFGPVQMFLGQVPHNLNLSKIVLDLQMDKASVRKKNEMQLQNNFDTIVCMGESKGGQIYKFCLDFHHFSKWHSGVYVEFSLLEMWWFDDFFFDLIGTHVFLFFVFSFTQQSSNQLCFV